MLTSSWRRASVMLVAVGAVGLAGCSSGGDTPAEPAGSTSAVAAPEAPPATAAAVAAGMQKIDQIAKGIAAAGADKVKAKALDDQIEPQWKLIENTVKANDENTYASMEEGFAVLETAADEGDAAAAKKGAAAISPVVQSYLAKYPAG
jgi:hypothetical protein